MSTREALTILDDVHSSMLQREAAAHFLETHASADIVDRLVAALQDDDQGVRWAAANSLAKLGPAALPALLRALRDPARVGDPRLREGIYHVLHTGRGAAEFEPLLRALHAFTIADISSMIEAERLLREIEAPAGRPDTPTAH